LCTALEESFGIDSASASREKEDASDRAWMAYGEGREFRKYLRAIKYPQW
jgi:hypothetical protein